MSQWVTVPQGMGEDPLGADGAREVPQWHLTASTATRGRQCQGSGTAMLDTPACPFPGHCWPHRLGDPLPCWHMGQLWPRMAASIILSFFFFSFFGLKFIIFSFPPSCSSSSNLSSKLT